MWKQQDQAESLPEYVETLKTIIYYIIEPNSFLKNYIPRKVDIKCGTNRNQQSLMRNMWKHA